jgi:hypothetical protein
LSIAKRQLRNRLAAEQQKAREAAAARIATCLAEADAKHTTYSSGMKSKCGALDSFAADNAANSCAILIDAEYGVDRNGCAAPPKGTLVSGTQFYSTYFDYSQKVLRYTGVLKVMQDKAKMYGIGLADPPLP